MCARLYSGNMQLWSIEIHRQLLRRAFNVAFQLSIASCRCLACDIRRSCCLRFCQANLVVERCSFRVDPLTHLLHQNIYLCDVLSLHKPIQLLRRNRSAIEMELAFLPVQFSLQLLSKHGFHMPIFNVLGESPCSDSSLVLPLSTKPSIYRTSFKQFFR